MDGLDGPKGLFGDAGDDCKFCPDGNFILQNNAESIYHDIEWLVDPPTVGYFYKIKCNDSFFMCAI